ncbi:hypothetical protein Fcan01_17372 [Folsomia candida]|uniref:Uncharacterized protein n=1 Tax=Folsomia candida TaxID=158441 RepID=A0A226DS31_FOLCA|nr:hypothetical protein Fcan01_17372 [Folsomia candida]
MRKKFTLVCGRLQPTDPSPWESSPPFPAQTNVRTKMKAGLTLLVFIVGMVTVLEAAPRQAEMSQETGRITWRCTWSCGVHNVCLGAGALTGNTNNCGSGPVDCVCDSFGK